MKAVADQLEKVLQDTLTEFQRADTRQWDQRPAPGKWSKKEILGHLTDSAINNLTRLVRATYDEQFKLVYYQDEWVVAQRYQDAKLDDLFDLWLLLNAQLSRVIRHYPQDRLNKQVDLGKEQPSFNSIEFIITDYISHLQHHLRQLFPLTP